MNGFNRLLSFGVVLILLLTSISIIDAYGSDDTRGPIFTITDIHVNVTYPDGGPASGVYIKVHREGYPYTWFRATTGYTNSSGQDLVQIAAYNLGPCYLTIYNLSKSSFVSIPIYVWPGEIPYHDVVLTPALPPVNVISGGILNRSSGTPTAQPTSISASGNDLNGLSFSVFNTTAPDGSFELKVPNSTLPINLQVSVLNSSESYVNFNSYKFLTEGVLSYPMDILLTPRIDAEVPVSLRFIDPSTGDPIEDLFSSFYTGSAAYRDHAQIDEYWFGEADEGGYLNLSMGYGEYMMSISTWVEEADEVTMGFQLPLIINQSTVDQEFEVSVPREFRTIELQINDSVSGDPIPGVYTEFSYRETVDDFSLDLYTYGETNPSGQMEFFIRPDIDFEIQIRSWGYEDTMVTIEAGPASSDLSLDIEMDPTTNIEVPQTNISIYVDDEGSGVPIPEVSIHGKGEYNGRTFSTYVVTENDGYYNSSLFYAGMYDLTFTSPLGSAELKDQLVSEDQNFSVNVSLKRKDFTEGLVEIEFELVDPEGGPLSEQPVYMFTPDYNTNHRLISDENGMVTANLRPDSYYLDNIGTFEFASMYRPHWIIPPGTMIDVQDGGSYGEITLYPADPLDEISGFVMDGDTGKVIPFANVKASSYHPLEMEDTRIGLSYNPVLDKEKALLYEQSSGSDIGGFYRVWGRERVDIQCFTEGYFPHFDTLDLTTRAVHQNDITLVRIPEFSTWINGTIVNDIGAPVQGFVKIYDGTRIDYLIGSYETGPDGRFSISTYPGDVRIEYFNLTMDGEELITIPAEGLDGLELVLRAFTTISGTIFSPFGERLEGATIWLFEIADNSTLVSQMNTTSDGYFEFQVSPGLYILEVLGPENMDGYQSDFLVATGWNDIELDIYLQNRTIAVEVLGTVVGIGGPYDMIGIPGIILTFMKENETLNFTTMTRDDGEFFLSNVDYGKYILSVIPPGDMVPQEEFFISGYLPDSSIEIWINERTQELDVTLEYVNYTPPGTFKILDHSPKGDNVSTVEPIRLWFSDSVNRTMLISALSIEPEVENLTFRFNSDGTAMALFHGGFLENTEYTITISKQLLSESGNPIDLEGDTYTWNFTTGTSSERWGLFSSVITIDYDRSWNFTVTGGSGQVVFIVIDGVGSFELAEEDSDDGYSYYSIFIEGIHFEWNTTYWFHYSDRDDGPDLAVDLSGSRHMPDEGQGIIPPPIWEISTADVALLENGDWDVIVEGNSGLDIFIVIDGLGSFLLAEKVDGEYSIVINVTNFGSSVEYDYHFSNETDGTDLSPVHGGSLVSKEIEQDEGDKKERSSLWILLLIIAILLILIGILVAIIAIRRQGEEEVFDWGEE